MKIVKAIGDGSCLIHSILIHVSDRYHQMTDIEKIKHVEEIRYELGNKVSEKRYNQIGKGTLKEVLSYEQWKELLLSNSPLGQESIEILSDYFDVNIFIYYKDFKLYPMDIYYNKNYQDVFIYWSGNHYDALFFSE
jgi:hypothetical protein